MDLILFGALMLVLIAGFTAVIFIFRKRRGAESGNDQNQGMLLLQNQVNEIAKVLDSKLTESSRIVERQFGESARMIKEITSELTKVNEGQRQVVGFADQLKSLQDILKNPKQRGILGEYYLETVLKNVLPPGSFQMQYSFSN